jgi:hypothetical protein
MTNHCPSKLLRCRPLYRSDFSERQAANVQAVLDAAERGLIPGGQYDAALIDEAHDFEPQWLALAAKMVNPDTKALMMVIWGDMGSASQYFSSQRTNRRV